MDYAHLVTKEIYFITLTVVRWIDLFTRPSYRHIIMDALEYCQKHKGLEIYGYVLMSNHLHAIVGTKNEKNKLSDILRDFKKFTARTIYETLQEDIKESRREWLLFLFQHEGKIDRHREEYKIWQRGSHEEVIVSAAFFFQKLNYIHQNPVRAEIVARAEDYLYSSARDYSGDKGLLEVETVR